MKVIYLFSNFDNNDGFTDDIAKNIKMDLVEYESLVFISSSPSGYDTSDFYLNINKNWFNNIGLYFNNYYLLDNRIENNKAIDIIQNSSCIFLMGGTTREQIKYIKDNYFIEPLQNHNGVIIGISAGAINLAVKTISFGYSENMDETIVYNGIGLTEKIIYPHFDIYGKEIDEIKNYSKNYDIYGLCDYAAIIEKANGIKMIGDIYKIKNKEIEKISSK
jgi:peptidase E